MKTRSIIVAGICLLALSVSLSSFIHKTPADGMRTEEYAVVDAIQRGKVIRVTIGTEPATETEWENDDYSSVLAALNKLNEKGFELLNTSLAYSTVSGGNYPMYGNSRHTFVMVKKIK